MALPKNVSFQDLLIEGAKSVPLLNEGVIELREAWLQGKDNINVGSLEELSAIDWHDRTCTPVSPSQHNLVEYSAPVRKKESIQQFCIDDIPHFFDANTYDEAVAAFIGRAAARISVDALSHAIKDELGTVFGSTSTSNITAGTAKSEVDQIITNNFNLVASGHKLVIYCNAAKFYEFLDDLGTAGTSIPVLTQRQVSIEYRGAIVALSPVPISGGEYGVIKSIHYLVVPRNESGASLTFHDMRETAEGMFIRLLVTFDYAMLNGDVDKYQPL